MGYKISKKRLPIPPANGPAARKRPFDGLEAMEVGDKTFTHGRLTTTSGKRPCAEPMVGNIGYGA